MGYVTCFLTAILIMAQIPDEKMQTVEYHGIRPTDPGGRNGLRNPERGWRIETLIAEPSGTKIWGRSSHLNGRITPGYNENWWILDTDRYEPYGLTLAQTYCYLDNFIGKPISDEKLALLQKSLDNLRKRGLKAVLRFAYEKDMDKRGGPTLDDILAHIDQLAPIIKKNTDVIYVLQAGFVGAWGEWHSSAHNLEGDHANLASIVAKVLDVLPPDRMTQVRVPKYKRWVLEKPILGGKHQILDEQTAHTGISASRIGFHNDGFLANNTCGGTWTEPPLYSNPGNPEFDYMTTESPYVQIDGELFWADIGGKVDGMRAIERFRLHHYSSFSIAHSYSEKEGKPFSIDDWMQTPLTAEQLAEANLPISDGYFKDIFGNEVTRTVFEYITDHLGYRLEMQKATFPIAMKVDDELTVEAEIINRGFSAIHNPRPVFFVLIDSDGQVYEFPVKADPAKWQPFQPGNEDYKPLTHKLSIRSKLPKEIKSGWYQLGLWLPDAYDSLRMNPHYAIRFANRDVPWWVDVDGKYGINIIGIIEITK
jgi:hypothetical protein